VSHLIYCVLKKLIQKLGPYGARPLGPLATPLLYYPHALGDNERFLYFRRFYYFHTNKIDWLFMINWLFYYSSLGWSEVELRNVWFISQRNAVGATTYT